MQKMQWKIQCKTIARPKMKKKKEYDGRCGFWPYRKSFPVGANLRDSKKLQKNLEIETKTGRLQNLRILFTDWDLITHLKRVFFFWCLANSFGSNAYFAPHRFCFNCSSFFSTSALPLFCIPSAFRTLLLLLTSKKCLKKIVSSKIW